MKAEMTIDTGLRGEKTILQKSYCMQPFKLADITENKKNAALHLMMMSSSPGILNGDDHEIKINVADKCSLFLQTQSFQRLYNMKDSASQKMLISVGDQAVFYFVPHPVVPHTNASFSSFNNIYLKKSSTLLWGEILTCGRKGSGEAFLFSRLHNCTKIFIEDKLIIKENILIEPLKLDVESIGQLEGFTHQATLIFIDEQTDINDKIAGISAYLLQQQNIEFGITAAPKNGLILRLLGYKGEQLFSLLKNIADGFLVREVTLTTV